MQDKKRFLNIDFEEYDNSIKTIKVDEVHVLFYSEKNDLLSKNLSINKNYYLF